MQNRQGKLKIFHRFIFDKINMCRKKLENKKINLIKNSKKMHFSKEVSPWFSSKIWDLPVFYFLKSRREKCVWRYSRSKNSLFRLKKYINFKNRKKFFFLDSKNTFFKNRKHCIFPKGLVYGSGQNLKFFLISFRQKIGKKNVFDDILEKKKPV